MMPSVPWGGTVRERALSGALERFVRWVTYTPERPDDRVLQRKAHLLAACTSVMVPVFVAVDAALSYQLVDYVPPYFGYPVLLASYVTNRAGLYRLAAGLVTGLVPFVVFGQLAVGAASDPALTLGYLPVGILLAAMFLSMKGVLAVSAATVFGIVVAREVAPQLRDIPSMVLPLSSTALCGAAAALYMAHRSQLEADRREAEGLLEIQLRQSQKMEAVGRLAGGIAHDFNNALTVISGNTDLLIRHVDRHELRNIRKAVDSASRLTRQLLAFSRRAMLHRTAVDLHAEVAASADMLARIIGEDVQVQVRTQPNLWRVCVDASQIQEMLLNLATNARDAMPSGGRLIFETANLGEQSFTAHDGSAHQGDYVLLSVTDTGTGMDEHVKQRMFEPFFTTKDVGKGTGLGLAMVFGGVTQNGGHVEVESAPGRGTTVRLLFPRSAAALAPEDAERSAAAAVTRESGTVLLVEDEPAVRALCEEILREQGYEVLAAADARQARALFAEHRDGIDVMITDLVMPGQGGLELADAVRSEVPDLPVLFMSGYADIPDALGAGVFLAKPFTAPALLAALKRTRAEPAGPERA